MVLKQQSAKILPFKRSARGEARVLENAKARAIADMVWKDDVKTHVRKKLGMLEVAFYGRHSDHDQVKSVPQQLTDAKDYVATHDDWNLRRENIFLDEAKTGRVASREAWQRLCAAAEAHKFDILLVWHLNRMGRNARESERLMDICRHNQITVLSIADRYDSRDPNEKYHRLVSNFTAEKFSDDLAVSVFRGMREQFKAGYWVAGPVFGYKLVPDFDPSKPDPYGNPERIGTFLRVNQETAKWVVYIYRRYADGASMRTICRELNEKKVPSPGSTQRRRVKLRRKGWVAGSLHLLLRNPVYIGWVFWNREKHTLHPTTGKRSEIKKPREEWHSRHQKELSIVSEKLWNKVQARFQNTKETYRRGGGRPCSIISGMLVCKTCGSHFIINKQKFLVCSGYINGGNCSNKAWLNREKVEAEILGGMHVRLLEPKRMEHLTAHLESEVRKQLRGMKVQVKEQPAALAKLKERQQRLLSMVELGGMGLAPDEWEAALEKLQKKIDLLEVPMPSVDEIAQELEQMPDSAALIREELRAGMSGDEVQKTKARTLLKSVVRSRVDDVWRKGEIIVTAMPNGEVFADFDINPAGFLQDSQGLTVTSGLPDHAVKPFHVRVRLK